MSIRAVHTDKAPSPKGAYSQGVVANGFLYTAGFGPHDPVSGQLVGTNAAEQTVQVLTNVQAVLATEGLDLSDVVKTTVHLHDLDSDFKDFNAAYEKAFSEPYPVRTTVGSRLAGILVEIDVVAALRSAS
jgi:2-iminobutanoate/2-iminopropanoate deaminase